MDVNYGLNYYKLREDKGGEFAAILQKLPIFKGTVYRGVAIDDRKLEEAIHSGKLMLTQHAAASTSKRVALGFGVAGRGETSSLLIIETTTGRKMPTLPRNQEALEGTSRDQVILPKGTRLQITKVSEKTEKDSEGGFVKIKLISAREITSDERLADENEPADVGKAMARLQRKRSERPSDETETSKIRKEVLKAALIEDPEEATGNTFLQHAVEAGPTPSNIFRSASMWAAEGSVEELSSQAAAAVQRLGGTEREFGAFVVTGGKGKTATGSNVALIMGSQGSVHVPISITQSLLQGSTAEFHHNHPLPFTVSIPDILFQNFHRGLLKMHAHDSMGGTSSVEIPGRDADNPEEGWNADQFEDELSLYSFKLSTSAEVFDLENEMVTQEDEATLASQYIEQHATNVGLHNAGFIKYEHTPGKQQQAWLDKYEKHVWALVDEATRMAKHINISRALIYHPAKDKAA